MSLHLLIVDAQQDFCDGPCHGALAIPGAYDDMSRVARMIGRLGARIDAIHATMDAHHTVDIAHPAWWMDATGAPPPPFTIVTAQDIESGLWKPRDPARRERSLRYVRQLEVQGNYPLCIWPPHCLIGSAGQSLHPELFAALTAWETARLAQVNYAIKGTNPWTEHYSAIRAEVADPEDAQTLPNLDLLQALDAADTVLIAGEALSHCVRATVGDIARTLGHDRLKRFVFLTDASTSVPGFEAYGEAFLTEMRSRGMRMSTTVAFGA